MGAYRLVTTDLSVGRVAEAGMVGAIAHWCEFLQGKATFQLALKEISNGLDAEATIISRVSRELSGKSNVIQFDGRAGLSRIAALDRSFARSMLGTYFDKPKVGSIWLKSMIEVDVDPTLIELHRRRNLIELVVIPLSVDEKTIDFAEMHFAFPLQFEHRALLNMVADTLARTWKNRVPGLLTECLSKTPIRLWKSTDMAPIMSMDNPARLSRAEYRVCLMLSRGQSFEKVRTELNVSKSTLRTHLKNIYAKTETDNQSELLYKLLTLTSNDGGFDDRQATA